MGTDTGALDAICVHFNKQQLSYAHTPSSNSISYALLKLNTPNDSRVFDVNYLNEFVNSHGEYVQTLHLPVYCSSTECFWTALYCDPCAGGYDRATTVLEIALTGTDLFTFNVYPNMLRGHVTVQFGPVSYTVILSPYGWCRTVVTEKQNLRCTLC